jgi:hypothetical protein
MKRQFTYAGLGGLLLTLACGPQVEIGHGNGGEAGQDGLAGKAQAQGGGSGSSPVPDTGGQGTETGGSETTAGGETTTMPMAGTSSGGTATITMIPDDTGPQAQVDKVDLLLAVDNSISMAEKQKMFAQTVPELLSRLVNPHCVNGAGVVTQTPASPKAACPAGSQREFAPLQDLHVGVITSSLGSHGAAGQKDVCVGAEDNDRAHLIPFVRNGVDSYDGKGYLNWDPNGTSVPPGESDVQAFSASLGTMIQAAGEHGCGYEAQLESVYRFLVDPDPPQSVVVPQGQTTAVKVGTDAELLKERASFLRPDSSVVVLLLTDENDCSIQDEGYGWLIARSAPMYRSTSACLTNPNDLCCQSCAESQTKAGCAPIAQDSECQKGMTLAQADDDLNLRCLNQKRRFGFDLLYPVTRYANGFGDGQVPNRAGTPVANPLFHQDGKSRDRSLFTLAVIGGVPWQDIATSASLTGDTLQYLTDAELETSKRWPVILGDPDNFTAPTDPFMRESPDPRGGQNPITGDKIVASTSTDPLANQINGHEQNMPYAADLQYACTFELPQPIMCDQARDDANQGCDCFSADLQFNRPLCNPPAGGPAAITQYFGKAYPALRELAVARQLGRRSVLGSICSRNTQDASRSDYGYRPVFSAIGQRIAATLVKP